jgi:hypothetical protein
MAFDYGLEHGISCHCHKYVESLLIELKKKRLIKAVLSQNRFPEPQRETHEYLENHNYIYIQASPTFSHPNLFAKYPIPCPFMHPWIIL